jgi:hypothetical protein
VDTGTDHSHSHSHAHAHGPVHPVSRHLRKVIAAVLVPFAAAVVAGLIVLWPGGVPAHERTGVGFDQQTQSGQVVKLVSLKCSEANAGSGASGDTSVCKRATIEVTSGKDKGRTFTR